MSLNSLAVGAVNSESGGAGGIPPVSPIAAISSSGAPSGGARINPPPSDFLSSLTKYIPTESITLYVSTVSAQQSLEAIGLTPKFTYWFFVGLTPLLMITLFLRQLAISKKNWRIQPAELPWWRIVASTIAFMTWALAVPGNPIISPKDSVQGAVAALAAVFVSAFLNIFEPFFEKPQ